MVNITNITEAAVEEKMDKADGGVQTADAMAVEVRTSTMSSAHESCKSPGWFSDGIAGGYVVGGSSSKQMTAREEAQWIAENQVCKGGCSFLSGGFGCGITGGFGGGGEAEEGNGGGGGGYSGGGGGAGAGGGGSYVRSDAEMVKKQVHRPRYGSQNTRPRSHSTIDS